MDKVNEMNDETFEPLAQDWKWQGENRPLKNGNDQFPATVYFQNRHCGAVQEVSFFGTEWEARCLLQKLSTLVECEGCCLPSLTSAGGAEMLLLLS